MQGDLFPPVYQGIAAKFGAVLQFGKAGFGRISHNNVFRSRARTASYSRSFQRNRIRAGSGIVIYSVLFSSLSVGEGAENPFPSRDRGRGGRPVIPSFGSISEQGSHPPLDPRRKAQGAPVRIGIGDAIGSKADHGRIIYRNVNRSFVVATRNIIGVFIGQSHGSIEQARIVELVGRPVRGGGVFQGERASFSHVFLLPPVYFIGIGASLRRMQVDFFPPASQGIAAKFSARQQSGKAGHGRISHNNSFYGRVLAASSSRSFKRKGIGVGGGIGIFSLHAGSRCGRRAEIPFPSRDRGRGGQPVIPSFGSIFEQGAHPRGPRRKAQGAPVRIGIGSAIRGKVSDGRSVGGDENYLGIRASR